MRKDRASMEGDLRWIYNEADRGFAEAKRARKPLLVVLRCVPCLACAGIDAQVVQEPELAPLLDQFVCVRVINANALDLARFQFDYDLSFSTMFFNGDGTVYGRYGSWTHQKDPADKTTAGYKRALEGVLALHRDFPGNKAALAGKQGAPMPFQNPTEIPELAGKYQRTLDWDGKVVQSCIHCHQIGDALRTFHRAEKKPLPAEMIFPSPAPETIGLKLAADAPAHVLSVAPGSPADLAGFKPGDNLVTLEKQPLISVADVSWVLHRAAGEATMSAAVRRDSIERALTITLPSGWREKSDISKRVGTWTLRAMATGGLLLEALSEAERDTYKLPPGELALLVKHVGEYGTHAAAKKAGFQKGDILVQVEGLSGKLTEGELIGALLLQRTPGQRVKTVVLRGNGRVELLLPIQ